MKADIDTTVTFTLEQTAEGTGCGCARSAMCGAARRWMLGTFRRPHRQFQSR
jgi:hypothetical protein